MNEDGEEIVENAQQNEEETEEPQIDFSKETAAALQEAEIEINTGEGEETDDDKTSVKEVVSAEDLYDGTIPERAVRGGARTAGVQVVARASASEVVITQDANADIIAETLNIDTETSDNTASNDSVIAAVNSETETSAAVAAVQQSYSSSSDEASTLSTESTGQNDSSVYLVIEGDTGISTSSSSGYSYGSTASTESAAPVSEIQDIVITNKDVADGEVLAAKQSLIVYEPDDFTFTPDPSVIINGTGSVQIGDAETTGVLHITSREGVTGSISDTRISVTEGTSGVTDVLITRQSETSNTSGTLTDVHIDLSHIKNEVSFTVEAATLSASSFNMPTGTLNLVNNAGISPIGPSYLNNINVDSTSNFYGGSTPDVNVKGHVNVELAPRTTASGGSSTPLAHGSTIENYQLYGLTLNTGATLNMDMKHIYVSESLSAEGGRFKVFMNGVRWDELTTGSYVTDLELLANTFSFTNLYDKFGKDIADRLVIRSGYYKGSSQNMELIVELLPDSVPEPTTATLSLLALTALAARRRRRV